MISEEVIIFWRYCALVVESFLSKWLSETGKLFLRRHKLPLFQMTCIYGGVNCLISERQTLLLPPHNFSKVSNDAQQKLSWAGSCQSNSLWRAEENRRQQSFTVAARFNWCQIATYAIIKSIRKTHPHTHTQTDRQTLWCSPVFIVGE